MSFIRRMFGKNEDDKQSSQNKPDASLKTSDVQEEYPSFSEPSEQEEFSYGIDDELKQEKSEQESLAKKLATVIDGATRPLPNDPIFAMNGSFQFGQTSDTGLVRHNNQDAAFSFFARIDTVENHPKFGLFIVADGMGGHHDGEKASSLVVRVMAKYILDKVYFAMLQGADMHDAERPPISEILSYAVKTANDAAIKEIPDGGTTVTGVLVMGEWAHLVHVGDSRAYMVTKESAEQLTRDHTLVQRLIELDQITVEESYEHPQRNVLYRAIGQNENVEVDTMSRRLPPNASILLCSDGLWGTVSNTQIREVVASTPSPQDACDKLVTLAGTLGSTDNITAVILRMPSQ